MMEAWREATEWSATTTATMPLEQASPRSLADDSNSDSDGSVDAEWAARPPSHDHKGGIRALLAMDADDDAQGTEPRRPVVHQRKEEDEADDVAARMELRTAEERMRTLETRLLDAEETIYHLKAEKLEAWRRVEKLSQLVKSGEGSREHGDTAAHSADEVLRLRTQVDELEGKLDDAHKQHAVEQEERMAVIREQEKEILELRERLAEVEGRADEADERYEELVRRTTSVRIEDAGFDDDRQANAVASGGLETVDDWQEELIRHPTPHFDLDSAEVQYLLASWTKNPKKLQYLRTWFTHVAQPQMRTLPDDFPLGVELPRLAPEIRDGFLTLVVPLLRKQPWREVQVHTKRYNDRVHTDLRIRIEPRRL